MITQPWQIVFFFTSYMEIEILLFSSKNSLIVAKYSENLELLHANLTFRLYSLTKTDNFINILQLGSKDFLASSKIVSNVMGASQKIEYGQSNFSKLS